MLAAGIAGVSLAACVTTDSDLACVQPDPGEQAVFTAIVAHDEARLADLMSPSSADLAEQVRELDPEVRDQIFGRRMGDRSVRSVLMQPPICVHRREAGENQRISYAFPEGRLQGLQNPDLPGPEFGRGGYDHAACRFEFVDERWRLTDACLTTFTTRQPAS
ncbi:hypothetical protein DDZ18_00760 [Marinicauda salina]|uniref:Uncharacterized protein n=1 Tax=Marinicauda salina TaxID=2135793 RepID=A0A2U2BVY0_9PROT|nr:hypothetical protein DDZ18_00760 [Marinicauda salina]